MSLLSEISAYLVAEGVATATGTDLFAYLPDGTTSLVMAIYETGGVEADQTFESGPVVTMPTFQFVARSATANDYAAARAKVKAAYDAFHLVSNETLSGTMYYDIRAIDEPMPIRRDETQRVIIGCNFMARKEAS